LFKNNQTQVQNFDILFLESDRLLSLPGKDKVQMEFDFEEEWLIPDSFPGFSAV